MCLSVPKFVYAQRCLACRATVKRDSASWCSACWQPGRPPEVAQACERCLGGSTYAKGFGDCVFGAGRAQEAAAAAASPK
jgi:hypothetical protein